jgi:hypothetical protein
MSLLTPIKKLKICFETITLGIFSVNYPQEKQLATFMRGYHAGRKDEKLENEDNLKTLSYCK